MKLDTLSKVFEQTPRVKLYVLTEEFGLCGYASKPHQGPGGLRVSIDSSVRIVLSSMSLLQEPVRSGTLFLTEMHKVTRRIQTHQRHLRDHQVPEEYFSLAMAL